MKAEYPGCGWTFFAGREEFKAGVFGLAVEKTTRKALRQVLLHWKTETFHCLDLTEVAIASWDCPPGGFPPTPGIFRRVCFCPAPNASRNGIEPNGLPPNWLPRGVLQEQNRPSKVVARW